MSSLGLAKGDKLFYAKGMAKVILPATLRSKGCDASNANDEEPAQDEMEFSDDEQEAVARANAKQKKRYDLCWGRVFLLACQPALAVKRDHMTGVASQNRGRHACVSPAVALYANHSWPLRRGTLLRGSLRWGTSDRLCCVTALAVRRRRLQEPVLRVGCLLGCAQARQAGR